MYSGLCLLLNGIRKLRSFWNIGYIFFIFAFNAAIRFVWVGCLEWTTTVLTLIPVSFIPPMLLRAVIATKKTLTTLDISWVVFASNVTFRMFAPPRQFTYHDSIVQIDVYVIINAITIATVSPKVKLLYEYSLSISYYLHL